MTQQRRVIISNQSATISIKPDTTVALREWLAIQASDHKLQWLLLHTEQGVVWGEQRGNTLTFSSDSVLSWNNLHQARLFGEDGELFLWYGPHGWTGRLVEDGKGEAAAWIDERQMLWGNRLVADAGHQDGFTVITEGSQGITHAPPIGETIPTERLRAFLLVRHYIAEDNAGVARVAYSRVVKLLKPGDAFNE